MPSKTFSGKQKKAQLQEKRARKRNKPLIGADTTSDSSGNDDNHYSYLHGEEGGGEAKAKHADDKGKDAEKADNDTYPSHHHKHHEGRGGRGGHRGGHRGGRGGGKPDTDQADKNAATDVYGGDKKGVRSEFKKEHRREIKERQQANYAPLLQREFIDAQKGIAFGQWFKVSNLSERRRYVTTVDGEQMGEGGFSSTFLYSIALPRRARMLGEDGVDIYADFANDSDDYDQGPRGGRGGRGVGRGGRGGKNGRGHHKGREVTDSSTTSSSSSSDNNNSNSDDDSEEEASGSASTSDSSSEGEPKTKKSKNKSRTKDSSSSSSSSSSSDDGDDEKDGDAKGNANNNAMNTNTKAGLKALKARLAAAFEHDTRERQVFRIWMNAIDSNFGVKHDAKASLFEGEEEAEEDDEKNAEEEGKEGNDAPPAMLKERRIGRRHRAVDNANDPTRKAKPVEKVHPLAHLELNLFERNIDVWRQLWRVVENSDVVVAVADSRYPIVHLPLSLFMHVLGECHKPVVVVLNKADLMTDAMLTAWEKCLRLFWDRALKPFLPAEKHALVDGITICRFTCSPEAGTALAKGDEKATSRRKKKGPRNARLYEELKSGESKKGQSLYAPSKKELKGKTFDYVAQEKQRRREEREARRAKGETNVSSSSSSDDDDDDDDNGARAEENLRKELVIVKGMIDNILNVCRRKGLGITDKDAALPPISDENRPVHIGFIGHPNVGKSSLINCIRGSKVVSVSATAGHTKHLQTVPLLADGVVLIDCPGLAFPVLGLPKPMQAVIGTHQIAQTRDPQSGVGYLGARLQLERIYALRKFNGDDNEPWSAYDICEAYGHKKGYHIKKGKGAVDVHRAAIALLSEAYEGRLVLSFAPPSDAYLKSPAFTNTVRKFLYLDPEGLNATGQE